MLKSQSRERGLLILGGGVAGYFLACFAKDLNPSLPVRVIDRSNRKPLSRILVSGNGRCNIFNRALLADRIPDDPLFAQLRRIWRPGCGQHTMAEFARLFQVPLYSLGDLMYPFSNRSDTVYQAVLKKAEKLGVETIYGDIEEVDCSRHIVSVDTGEEKVVRMASDLIALCLGGSCLNYPQFDWGMFKGLNAEVVPYTPALGPIPVREDLSSLEGYRLRGTLQLCDRGHPVYREEGEVLFRKREISGICAFNCSIRLDPARVSDFSLALDGTRHDGTQLPPAAAIDLSVPSRVAQLVFMQARARAITPYAALSDLRFSVAGLPTFKNSQVSCGGVSLDSLDRDLQLKGNPGIYCLGEMVDIPLPCGGFNIGMCIVEALLVAEALSRGE